jgi:hypothetical protein
MIYSFDKTLSADPLTTIPKWTFSKIYDNNVPITFFKTNC